MSDLNTTLALLTHHKTIRQFKPQPIATDIIEKLIATAQHTATSNFCQNYSIISVTDSAKNGPLQRFLVRITLPTMDTY
ncbi:hypothetical protein [Loigolactobacillus backii]|uniref:hypothetical protein n=1 Tax=Loigolactobacillus backii TaxID=375175 RepID=UPI001EE6A3CF|nr:hypothetical protein [Loigolactobacillus backii]